MELQTLSMKNLPRVPIFARGPFGPLGENGNPWEVFHAYGLQFHLFPRHPCRNYPFLPQIFKKITCTGTPCIMRTAEGGGVENTICQAMFRFEPPAKTYRHTWLEKPTLWKTKGRTADSFIMEFFRLSALMFCAAYNSMAYVFFSIRCKKTRKKYFIFLLNK